MEDLKDIISEDIKTEYRAGSFLPENYKSSQSVRPAWLEENLINSRESQLEELEGMINDYKIKLGL